MLPGVAKDGAHVRSRLMVADQEALVLQLRPIDHGSPRERMTLGKRDDQTLRPEEIASGPRPDRVAELDDHVDGIGQHAGRNIEERRFDQFDFDIGILIAKVLYGGAQAA